MKLNLEFFNVVFTDFASTKSDDEFFLDAEFGYDKNESNVFFLFKNIENHRITS